MTTAGRGHETRYGKRYESTSILPASQPAHHPLPVPPLQAFGPSVRTTGKPAIVALPRLAPLLIGRDRSGDPVTAKPGQSGFRATEHDRYNSLFRFSRRFWRIPHDHQTQFRHVLDGV